MVKHLEVYQGVLVDDEVIYSLEELCEISQSSEDFVLWFVDYGLIQNKQTAKKQLKFTVKELQLIQMAKRLIHDFELNEEALDLVLDLIIEVNNLRDRVKDLEYALANLY